MNRKGVQIISLSKGLSKHNVVIDQFFSVMKNSMEFETKITLLSLFLVNQDKTGLFPFYVFFCPILFPVWQPQNLCFHCRQYDIGSRLQPLSNKFLEGFSCLLELSSTRNCLVKINIVTLSDARRWSRLNRPLYLIVLMFHPFVIIILRR